MDADLAEKLHRRFRRIESIDSSSECSSSNGNGIIDEFDSDYSRPIVFNPYLEYNEFSRKQIQKLMNTFEKFDTDKDKALDFHELKYMMEKLGIPQTHLKLKEIIQRVDEDCDGKISFREFLLIFRKVLLENPDKSSIFSQFYALIFEIDVSKEGVCGAKHFFEAKAAAINENDKFHREIRQEQEERRRTEEDKLRRKLAFQNRLAHFQF